MWEGLGGTGELFEYAQAMIEGMKDNGRRVGFIYCPQRAETTRKMYQEEFLHAFGVSGMDNRAGGE